MVSCPNGTRPARASRGAGACPSFSRGRCLPELLEGHGLAWASRRALPCLIFSRGDYRGFGWSFVRGKISSGWLSWFLFLFLVFSLFFLLSSLFSSRVSWLRPVVRSWKSFVRLIVGPFRSVVEIAPARQSFVRGNSESFSFSFSLLLFLFSLFSFSFHFSFSSSRVSWLRPVVRSWKSFVKLNVVALCDRIRFIVIPLVNTKP